MKLDERFINQQVKGLFLQLGDDPSPRTIAGQHMGDEYDKEIAVRLASKLRAAGAQVAVSVTGAGWFSISREF